MHGRSTVVAAEKSGLAMDAISVDTAVVAYFSFSPPLSVAC